MIFNIKSYLLLTILLLISLVGLSQPTFPDPKNPPRLVNDFANVMSINEQDALEQKLLDYNKTSSIEIAIVTINDLNGYPVSDYTIQLANKWKIGKKDKNNGVIILASIQDKKMFIATGYGMEGSITDMLSGQIYRNIMAPEFRKGDYYMGFLNAADAIIKASKGEYTAEPTQEDQESTGSGVGAIIIIIVLIIIFISVFGKGNKGGGSGPTYTSRRGSDILTGAILGELLRGGSRGGGFGGGGFGGGFGGGSSGGGFGGFGGGSFGGGGAGGSW